MNAIAFDTHAFIKRLTAAGMPERQAEVLAEEQAKLIETHLATKTDLQGLELRLDSKIELVKRDLKIWFGSVMAAAVGILLAAIRYLPAH